MVGRCRARPAKRTSPPRSSRTTTLRSPSCGDVQTRMGQSMNLCIHKYGDWVEYTTEITTGLPNAASNVFKQSYDQIRQKRYCIKCKVVQIRIPKENVQ